eukprot:SAG31_NODE_384_length_16414_cov_7.492308_8_plen_59_part_00
MAELDAGLPALEEAVGVVREGGGGPTRSATSASHAQRRWPWHGRSQRAGTAGLGAQQL